MSNNPTGLYPDSNTETTTTKQKKKVIIVIWFNKNNRKQIYRSLAVAEDFQGGGIGTLMIKNAFATAKQQGYKIMLIGTSTPNIWSLYLHPKMRFEYDHIIKLFCC